MKGKNAAGGELHCTISSVKKLEGEGADNGSKMR